MEFNMRKHINYADLHLSFHFNECHMFAPGDVLFILMNMANSTLLM